MNISTPAQLPATLTITWPKYNHASLKNQIFVHPRWSSILHATSMTWYLLSILQLIWKMFSNQLPTMTARKIPQVLIMANTTNGTTICTHQYCPMTNHPTTPSALHATYNTYCPMVILTAHFPALKRSTKTSLDRKTTVSHIVKYCYCPQTSHPSVQIPNTLSFLTCIATMSNKVWF